MDLCVFCLSKSPTIVITLGIDRASALAIFSCLNYLYKSYQFPQPTELVTRQVDVFVGSVCTVDL